MSKIFKYLKFILLLFCIPFLMCGCTKLDQVISIDEDGNVNNSLTIWANENLENLLFSTDGRIYQSLNDAGYTDITTTYDVGLAGLKGSQTSTLKILKDNLNNNENTIYHIQNDSKDYFVYQYYDLSLTINPSDFISDTSYVEDYKFTLILPIPVKESNADGTQNEGKTLIWNLDLNSDNTMHIEVGVLNIKNVAITISIIVFVLIILLLLLKPRRNKISTTIPEITETSFCEECGNKIEDSMDFCPNCGHKIDKEITEEIRYCGNCGTKIELSMEYCPNCGSKQD